MAGAFFDVALRARHCDMSFGCTCAGEAASVITILLRDHRRHHYLCTNTMEGRVSFSPATFGWLDKIVEQDASMFIQLTSIKPQSNGSTGSTLVFDRPGMV